MADSNEQRAEALRRIEEAARTGATELNLSNMGLTELPPEIWNLTKLTKLYLVGNRLTVLPPQIGNLTKLISLDVIQNQLAALPAEIENLTKLEGLVLNRNRLAALPREIGKLTSLIVLDLEENQLTALPPGIGKLTNLSDLRLFANQLTALPPEIGKLTNLTTLDLSRNQLTALPPEIGKLTNLTTLDLRGNQLTALPPEIGKLTNLTELYLYENQLTALPPEIGNLTNVTGLYLLQNQLTTLPPEIGKLTNLTGLGLCGNQLTALPPEIGNLTNLTTLDLRENQLTVLPPEIWNLTNLTTLALSENQLTALPPEIGKLTNLAGLFVDGNPLPAEILRLAEEGELIAYLRDLAAQGEKARPFNEAKLLLIGPGEVGKTWLLQALQGKVPQPTGSTQGIEIAREPLDVPHPTDDDRVIHFNCWDFGGQDYYQVTHQIFFSPKAVYLLVWKPRPGIDPDLFARLERIELSAGRTAKVFIVSTHADDPVPAVLGKEAIRERFGDLIGGFFGVDSRKGPDGTGIAELKEAIAGAAAELEGIDDPVPASWHGVYKTFREMGEATITFDEFANEIHAKHEISRDSAERLAIVLDVLGHVVYFSEAASGDEAAVTGADNLVVLDPEWLAKAVGKVIADEDTIERSGVLEHRRLPVIWKDHAKCYAGPDKCLCGYLLWLMWKFDVAYRLNEQESLVPEMIQRSRPDNLLWTPSVQPPERQATLIGRIPHNPPPGLVPVFTSAVHPLRRIDHEPDPLDRNWRNGFFLDTPRRGTAFVELQDRDLLMTVRHDYPAHLLGLLHNTLKDAIKDRWPNLNIDYRIPCSGYLNGKPCPGSFKLSYLKPRRGANVSCQDCGNDAVPVDPLLDGYDVREERMMDILKQLAIGQQEHMALALKMYHDVLDPARAELERAPCMISILPDAGKWWNVVGAATQQSYRVTCWCEHPDGPHPGAPLFSGDPPDYKIKMPRDWLVKAAPYISWFAMLAKTFVPLAGKVVEAGMEDLLDDKLRKRIELMGDCAKALPSGKLELDSRYELEPGSIHGQRPEILALTEVHDALEDAAESKNLSKSQRWGNLRPVRTRAHGLLWLCPKHAAIQDPPMQRITGEG